MKQIDALRREIRAIQNQLDNLEKGLVGEVKSTGILPFGEWRGLTSFGSDSRSLDSAEVFLSTTQSQVVCMPFRLVIEAEKAVGWEVARCRIGMSEVFVSPSPVPASAYHPLPPWLSQFEVLEDNEVSRAVIAASPFENIERVVLQIGMEAEVTLLRVGAIGPPPRAWFLVRILDVGWY